MTVLSFQNSVPSFRVAASLLAVLCISVEAFAPSQCTTSRILDPQRGSATATQFQRNCLTFLRYSNFIEDEDDDDEDDDVIDADSLGDWRTFRRNLASLESSASSTRSDDVIYEDDSDLFEQVSSSSSSSSSPLSVVTEPSQPKSVSKDNEELLLSQNEDLAKEYMTGVWAHETSTPEVGGLMVRMPLEVELHRNYKHSLIGRKLKRIVGDDNAEISTWFAKAQQLVAEEMQNIAAAADDQGQIDVPLLADDGKEMLTLFLDNQETWQEVCLVLEQGSGENAGLAKTLVLNRPMAMKLTDNLAKMVLNGAFPNTVSKLVSNKDTKDMTYGEKKDMINFILAFGNECAVYVGGPDDQDKPAIMVHGIPDLPGSTEISPGSNLYRGGIAAAVQGVLDGKYNPLEFRFFVGCHSYEDHGMELSVHLGKYQPVACARSVALKQCISLPKPLWHEVLELCGGDLEDISSVELLKRDELHFQVVEDVEELLDEDDEIPDELGELENLDDDEDDYF